MNDHLTFKIKKYLHFSDKIEYKNIRWVNGYISNPKSIKSHKFYPFIHRQMKQRKFRRCKEGESSTQRKQRIADVKIRHISYANHLDRCVYSHYASKLVKAYETLLKKEPLLNDAVIAYRSKEYSEKNLSNAALAKEVFDIIKKYPKDSFRVIAMDVSSFFDELSHPVLKSAWKELMYFTKGMPDDHYAVFKNITRYSYVDYHDVFNAFADHHKKKKPKFLRSSKVISFSPTADQFRERIIDKGLVRKPPGRDLKKGIPQGSPISPVLANIYMINFDRHMSDLMESFGGYYRRYSDDILFIYNNEHHDTIYSETLNQIGSGKCHLRINESKNQVYIVERRNNNLTFKEQSNGSWITSRGFEYLGFLFNGKVVRLKSSSLSKYYRKMKRSVRRSAYYAATTGRLTGRKYIYKNMIYKKFTHLGATRRLRHKRGPVGKDGKFEMIVSKKMDWGNFMSYAQQSTRIFEGSDSKSIKMQIKYHMKKVQSEIKKQTIKRKLDKIL